MAINVVTSEGIDDILGAVSNAKSTCETKATEASDSATAAATSATNAATSETNAATSATNAAASATTAANAAVTRTIVQRDLPLTLDSGDKGAFVVLNDSGTLTLPSSGFSGANPYLFNFTDSPVTISSTLTIYGASVIPARRGVTAYMFEDELDTSYWYIESDLPKSGQTTLTMPHTVDEDDLPYAILTLSGTGDLTLPSGTRYQGEILTIYNGTGSAINIASAGSRTSYSGNYKCGSLGTVRAACVSTGAWALSGDLVA